jgi:hypothetical protein
MQHTVHSPSLATPVVFEVGSDLRPLELRKRLEIDFFFSLSGMMVPAATPSSHVAFPFIWGIQAQTRSVGVWNEVMVAGKEFTIFCRLAVVCCSTYSSPAAITPSHHSLLPIHSRGFPSSSPDSTIRFPKPQPPHHTTTHPAGNPLLAAAALQPAGLL